MSKASQYPGVRLGRPEEWAVTKDGQTIPCRIVGRLRILGPINRDSYDVGIRLDAGGWAHVARRRGLFDALVAAYACCERNARPTSRYAARDDYRLALADLRALLNSGGEP